MAESQSMTSAEVMAKALIEEHPDFLRESVAMVARELMEAEISRQIGAGRGEVSEARSTHRNGYRPRPWATRVGESLQRSRMARRMAIRSGWLRALATSAAWWSSIGRGRVNEWFPARLGISAHMVPAGSASTCFHPCLSTPCPTTLRGCWP
jgi:hypothetical protein